MRAFLLFKSFPIATIKRTLTSYPHSYPLSHSLKISAVNSKTRLRVNSFDSKRIFFLQVAFQRYDASARIYTLSPFKAEPRS
ncbi:Hypothetical protein FKW44_019461 [Caligus rogercresseyi]|uniref:Uncharacterized protein n=1 Tax=Caligus rogercresseyi TaxID=217165 RepID=A0A7T8GWI0_CALRO|nr:Hypothetical protein FKW44_019461 [Caligus rogercresseyi]